jgi:hypothetical protein
MMKVLRTGALLLGLLTGQNGFAQFSLAPSVSTMYDDNVNNNYQQIRSSISTLSLSTGYTWQSEVSISKIYYDGSYDYFQALPERTNHNHSVNAAYSHAFGDDGEKLLNLGGAYGINLNRGTYVFFDHSAVSAFANYKYFINERIINKIGYSFRTLAFSTLKDLSYSEHTIFIHGAFAVTQTTTAILQADLGAKYYSSAATAANSTTGQGKSSSIAPDVTQLIGTLKVGQSLAERTGVSLTMRYQFNLQKESRYLSAEYGFISDDEIFDDHYGYEGLHTSIMLTQLLSETMLVKVTGGIQNKMYSSLSAFDLGGNLLADERKDARQYLNLLLEKRFPSLGISLKGAVDIIRNKSNDSYYDYRNNAYTIELGIPF